MKTKQLLVWMVCLFSCVPVPSLAEVQWEGIQIDDELKAKLGIEAEDTVLIVKNREKIQYYVSPDYALQPSNLTILRDKRIKAKDGQEMSARIIFSRLTRQCAQKTYVDCKTLLNAKEGDDKHKVKCCAYADGQGGRTWRPDPPCKPAPHCP